MPMAPGQPLFLMWSGVNRVTNEGNLRGPEQRVSRLGALKAVTLDAAYSLQMEKEVGSIVPGKLANFTILADNPLTVDPMKVKDIRVWGTVHEGRVLPVRQPAQARAGVDAAGTVARPSALVGQDDLRLAQVIAERLAELLAHRHGDGD
jgi:adenine deaminase